MCSLVRRGLVSRSDQDGRHGARIAVKWTGRGGVNPVTIRVVTAHRKREGDLG